MQSVLRLASRLATVLVASCLGSAQLSAEPATGGDGAATPKPVTEAIAASPAPQAPMQVIVGAYINDIQELDFKTNSYAVDLYVWFRWKPSADLNPGKTMEFMNRYAPDDDVRTDLYDTPKQMPDGTLYWIVRNQGQFSTKFRLEKYPFDTQNLIVLMEDTVAGADSQVYVPDKGGGVSINPEITLPGFKVGQPVMKIANNTYPTDFGDLTDPDDAYSRITLLIPVSRLILAMTVKTFVPIALIVVCAALVFFVRPHYVEGRIGLGITALLTLVALQLTSGASLPDVDYLMMIDKVYLLAYLFIIVALARVVWTSWGGADEAREPRAGGRSSEMRSWRGHCGWSRAAMVAAWPVPRMCHKCRAPPMTTGLWRIAGHPPRLPACQESRSPTHCEPPASRCGRSWRARTTSACRCRRLKGRCRAWRDSSSPRWPRRYCWLSSRFPSGSICARRRSSAPPVHICCDCWASSSPECSCTPT